MTPVRSDPSRRGDMQVALTPRGLPDPGAPPMPEKTLSRWRKFLGSIAAGILLPDAMKEHYISRADIEACVRSDPAERTAWDDAKLSALKRGWSAFDFEDIFERIASGMPAGKALEEVKGSAGGAVRGNFYRIIIQDSALNDMYVAALKARSLGMSEEIIEIADDDTKDMATNDKGGDVPNNAAVNRSKLKVETRTRLMGAWHTKMFGEAKNNQQVNVQVNYAANLEAARARAIKRSDEPGIPARVIDAAFSEVVDPKDDPMDTTWLEEK